LVGHAARSGLIRFAHRIFVGSKELEAPPTGYKGQWKRKLKK